MLGNNKQICVDLHEGGCLSTLLKKNAKWYIPHRKYVHFRVYHTNTKISVRPDLLVLCTGIKC